VPASVLVSTVSEGSAAEQAGLRPGDLIFGVDGGPVGSFASFADLVRASGGRTLEVAYARDGTTTKVEITPRKTRLKNAADIEEDVYLIGIVAEDATLPGAAAIDQERNPLRALPRAVVMTLETTEIFVRGLGKLVSGDIPRSSIGGPIEIARQSHLAFQAGWDSYLRLLILISINLGILNLLPIPVLDGGQALLFAVEGVKRSPLSIRTREMVQQFGVAVLIFLMGFAFWNDISRHWSKVVDWVRESAGL
jgi:regulator of sigma E protease